MKRGDIILWRHNAQIDLYTLGQARKASVFIKLIRLNQRGKAEEPIEDRPRSIAGGDNPNRPDRFFAPSKGSRNIRLNQIGTDAQVPKNALPCFESVMEGKSAALRRLERLNARKELRL